MTVFLILGLACLAMAMTVALRTHRDPDTEADHSEPADRSPRDRGVRSRLRRVITPPGPPEAEVIREGAIEREPLPRRPRWSAHLVSWSVARCQDGSGSGAGVAAESSADQHGTVRHRHP